MPEPIHRTLAPNLAQLVSNLLITTSGAVHAGYWIGPARWEFTSMPDREAALDSVQDGWAALVSASRPVQERVTTVPHAVRDWAARLDARTPHPLPDVHACDRSMSDADQRDGRCGCETYNRWLERQQNVVALSGMDDKATLRYFHIGDVDPGRDVRAEVHTHTTSGTRPSEEVRQLFVTEKRTRDVVTSQFGWKGRRVTEREQAWLRYRSIAIGVPAPRLSRDELGGWDRLNVAALTGDVRWHEDPFDRTVAVTAWRGGKRVDRAVQVLTLARYGDQRYPQNNLEPWQVFAERAIDADGRPFPVEWNIVGQLRTGTELAAQTQLDVNLARNIRADYIAIEEEPPAYTERGIIRAREVQDEVTTGATRDAARFVGTVNVAVFGEDRTDERGRVVQSAAEVAEERGEAFARLYGGSAMRMEFAVPQGQSRKLAEFLTGEPVDDVGFRRHMPLGYLAAGFSNVTNAVGDGHGPYHGYTRGSTRRPVHHDPHYATEGQGAKGRQQNIWIEGGTLGAGKSVDTGVKVYNSCRRGILNVVGDPSGRLGALTRMPELAPWSLDMNLLESDDGVLSPPALVRDPRRAEHGSDDKHVRAVKLAQGERRALTEDVARRCLQWDLHNHPATQGTLRHAARRVERWSTATTMWDVVDGLDALGEVHATDIANALRDAADMPRLSLLFAPRGEGGDFALQRGERPVLTVISTPGIKRAADGVDRADWNPDELAANPVLHLAQLYTLRELYGKPMAEPAVAVFDEAEDMLDGGTGRAAMARLGRDHSKWNIAVYLCLKNVDNALLGGGLRNFIAGAFIGRTASEQPALEMLDVLNLKDPSYARTLMRLSQNQPGEFVHSDVDGNVGGIRTDVDYFPRLKEALLTTPASAGGEGAWKRDEVLG